jgi:hypothetical protein
MKNFFALVALFALFSTQAFAQTEELDEAPLDEAPKVEVEKKTLSIEEQIEANEVIAPTKKAAPAPAPVSPLTPSLLPEEATQQADAPKENEGFLGLDFTEPIGRKHSWYRGSGEWIASRTVRDGLVGDEPVTKILTEGKRYDVTIGKRVPLLVINEESLTRAWSVGFDGGMMVTLFRSTGSSSNVAFASENFDGFFGLYVARAMDDTIIMYRMGHISSHLVDNNRRVTRAIAYSRFWNEIIVSRTLSTVTAASPWDIHVQASLGANFKSEPKQANPRWLFGFDIGRTLGDPDSLAAITSFDVRHAGVKNQGNDYAAFLGIGRLRRPENTHRPYRIGVSHHWGSDYRNQYYLNRSKYTAFEIQIEL